MHYSRLQFIKKAPPWQLPIILTKSARKSSLKNAKKKTSSSARPKANPTSRMTTLLKVVLTTLMQERHLLMALPIELSLFPMKKPGSACSALPGFFMGLAAQTGASISRARSAMASAVWSRGVSTRAALYCTKLRRIDCR